MDTPPPDGRPSAPATRRNREPILAVLRRVLPGRGLVLEIASGTGEHAEWFAPRLPGLTWQPSDPDAGLRAAIDARRAGIANLRPPLHIDARSPEWGIERAAAVVCINMIHVAPWAACEGLMAGAGRVLEPGGPLYLYGPFRRGGRHTAPSNAEFDAMLRRHDPDWGVRDLDEVAECAGASGLDLDEVVEMPANNLSLVFRRRAGI